MKEHRWIRSRAARWGLASFLSVLLLGACGCKTLSYYAQAARGQYQILALQEPVEKLLKEPQTPDRLKGRLELLQKLRSFAESELRLPVDGHYKKYADLGRPYVVWNVEAAPEFSMEPKGWWYPFVGRLEYRGYFAERAAREYAQSLEQEGLDVHVGGATAYSTLGWFHDPVLNTFAFFPEPFFAETLFHELAHQRVFASGDKDFNEAFATFVGREGVRRWLSRQNAPQQLADYQLTAEREDSFAQLVIDTRTRLERLFGDTRDDKGKVRARRISVGDPAQLRQEKARLIEELRRDYSRLREKWADDTTYDKWFSRPINNAKLNSVAAYHEFVPSFAHLLSRNGGDLVQFYEAAERLSKLKKAERHFWLRELQKAEPEGGARAAAVSR